MEDSAGRSRFLGNVQRGLARFAADIGIGLLFQQEGDEWNRALPHRSEKRGFGLLVQGVGIRFVAQEQFGHVEVKVAKGDVQGAFPAPFEGGSRIDIGAVV